MTNIHWRNAVDGKFSKAANWRGKEVPGENDNAILDAAGNPYTVTYHTDQIGEIGGVRLASNATLKVEGRGFSTFDLVNAGSVFVNTEAGGALGCDTLTNTGTIRVDAVLGTDNPAGYPDINYNSGLIEIIGAIGRTAEFTMMGDGTLSGGGAIRLENGGSLNGGVINNVDNTISGDGEIYAGLVNEAAGLIDASDGKLLTIASNEYTVTNDGTIQTTGTGGALIDSQLINTGELRASSGALTLAQRVAAPAWL